MQAAVKFVEGMWGYLLVSGGLPKHIIKAAENEVKAMTSQEIIDLPVTLTEGRWDKT